MRGVPWVCSRKNRGSAHENLDPKLNAYEEEMHFLSLEIRNCLSAVVWWFGEELWGSMVTISKWKAECRLAGFPSPPPPILCLKKKKKKESLTICILYLSVFFCHVLLKLFGAVFLLVRKAALHIWSDYNPNTKLACYLGLCVLNPFFSRPCSSWRKEESTFFFFCSNSSAVACIYSINDSYGNCFALPVPFCRDPGLVHTKWSHWPSCSFATWLREPAWCG